MIAGQAFFSTGANQLFAAALQKGFQICCCSLLFLFFSKGNKVGYIITFFF